MLLSNGFEYEGDFNNNIIEGQGKVKYPNGDFYQGNFENGLKCGFGTI